MDCPRARLLLLQAEAPGSLSGELLAHVRHCYACRSLAESIVRMEAAYRTAPDPAALPSTREAFLKKLTRHPSMPARRAARSWRTVSIPRAAAAVLLLAFGMGALMLLPATPVQAAPDLVERLVSWNLDLAAAATPEQRHRIHQDRVSVLARSVRLNGLPLEEQQLAQQLLASGETLLQERDLLREADQLTALADLLIDHLELVLERGNELRANQLARQVSRVSERGLAPRLERAARGASPERLARLLERETRRIARLESLMGKAPKTAQKEMKQVIEKTKKQQKIRRKSKG